MTAGVGVEGVTELVVRLVQFEVRYGEGYGFALVADDV